MKMSPCKGCQKRRTNPNCHMDCGDGYIEYAAERQEYYQKHHEDGKIYEYIDIAKKRKKIPRKRR